METASLTTEDPSQKNGPGPGGKLQAARIQQGLSIGDVADRMHLSNAILEALEENNFDEITAPIFVKGYLRAYARILTLDEESIINEYIELYSDEDPPITSTSNTISEISSSDARMKWMTYLVVFILIALVGAWWWSQQHDSEPLISLDAEQAETPVVNTENAVVVEPAADEPLLQIPDEQNESTPEEENQVDSNADAASIMSLQPEVSSSSSVEAVDEGPAAIEPTMTRSDTQIQETSAGLALQTGTSASSTQKQAPEGDDRFRLVVNADTWADIKDATGFQLIYDLMRANTTLLMTGTAPFQVFLGNGHGVDVEINDVPMDITSYIRDDNTARFLTDS